MPGFKNRCSSQCNDINTVDKINTVQSDLWLQFENKNIVAELGISHLTGNVRTLNTLLVGCGKRYTSGL